MWVRPKFNRLIQFKIDDELYQALVNKASKDKTTLSFVIRSACEAQLRKR